MRRLEAASQADAIVRRTSSLPGSARENGSPGAGRLVGTSTSVSPAFGSLSDSGERLLGCHTGGDIRAPSTRSGVIGGRCTRVLVASPDIVNNMTF